MGSIGEHDLGITAAVLTKEKSIAARSMWLHNGGTSVRLGNPAVGSALEPAMACDRDLALAVPHRCDMTGG
jgi:hypothetical protein